LDLSYNNYSNYHYDANGKGIFTDEDPANPNFDSFWMSGGCITGGMEDLHAETGEWEIDADDLPEQFRELADEIKVLISQVNASIEAAGQESEKLSSSMENSIAAMDRSLREVDETKDTFKEIIESANGANAVQQEINDTADAASVWSILNEQDGAYAALKDELDDNTNNSFETPVNAQN
jgi:hypothetical protein